MSCAPGRSDGSPAVQNGRGAPGPSEPLRSRGTPSSSPSGRPRRVPGRWPCLSDPGQIMLKAFEEPSEAVVKQAAVPEIAEKLGDLYERGILDRKSTRLNSSH